MTKDEVQNFVIKTLEPISTKLTRVLGYKNYASLFYRVYKEIWHSLLNVNARYGTVIFDNIPGFEVVGLEMTLYKEALVKPIGVVMEKISLPILTKQKN